MSPHIKHLAIAALVAVVVLLCVWKVIAYAGNTAHDARVLAEAQLKEDLEKAKVQAQATAQDKQALQGQLNALAASNDALRRDLASLRAQLADQRARNDSLAPDALSERWSMLLGLPGQIQPSAGGIVASLPAAHATVNQLEEIPILKAEAQKTAANSSQKDATIGRLQAVQLDLENELATCKKTVADSAKLCDAKVSEQKAKGRKRNVVVAVLAAVGGFLIRSKI